MYSECKMTTPALIFKNLKFSLWLFLTSCPELPIRVGHNNNNNISAFHFHKRQAVQNQQDAFLFLVRWSQLVGWLNDKWVTGLMTASKGCRALVQDVHLHTVCVCTMYVCAVLWYVTVFIKRYYGMVNSVPYANQVTIKYSSYGWGGFGRGHVFSLHTVHYMYVQYIPYMRQNGCMIRWLGKFLI